MTGAALTGELPAGLADPLHLSLPVPWKLLATLATLLLLSIAWVLIRRWLARLPAPRRKKPAPAPRPPHGLANAIKDLRSRYRKSRDFRRACHELSALVRDYLERVTRQPYSTLTAHEIEREIGDEPGARFFGTLAELQFGRHPPTSNDLDGACELALDVALVKRTGR